MAFAGDFGAAAALVPFALITNILGETSPGYDADGNITFTKASGQVYTPARVDTLIIAAGTDQTAPLGICQAGAASIANVDTGQLTTAAAGANQHGLPKNFGPGRGNWGGTNATGHNRLRVTAIAALTVNVVADAAGSLQALPAQSGTDATATVRSFFGEVTDSLQLIVECVHSVQG